MAFLRFAQCSLGSSFETAQVHMASRFATMTLSARSLRTFLIGCVDTMAWRETKEKALGMAHRHASMLMGEVFYRMACRVTSALEGDQEIAASSQQLVCHLEACLSAGRHAEDLALASSRLRILSAAVREFWWNAVGCKVQSIYSLAHAHAALTHECLVVLLHECLVVRLRVQGMTNVPNHERS